MIGTLIILLLFFYFYFSKNHVGIVAIILFSLMNDLIVFSFGFSLPIHYLISLIYTPILVFYFRKINYNLFKYIFPIYIEFYYLIVLAIVFGFFFPWEDSQDLLRSWSQKSSGRAVVQTLRLFAEINLILLIIYFLKSKRIDFNKIINLIVVTFLITFLITVTDFYFNNQLKTIFFSDARLVEARFSGFNGEPRAFGRICGLTFIVLFAVKNYIKNKKAYKLVIVCSFVGVLLSLSASSILMTLLGMMVYIIFSGKMKIVIVSIPIFFISYHFLMQNELFKKETLYKIETTLNEEDNFSQKEKVNSYEPDFFSQFEIFDRAALNFFYFNREYILFGTGPNLISIPSSKYLTETNANEYENRIDSVPHSFLINLLARSGLIGVLLWLIYIVRLSLSLKRYDRQLMALFISISLANFMVFTSYFLLINALILYLIYNYNNNDKHSNTSL